MQLNPDYIPSPAVNERLSTKFHMPIFMNIAYESVLLHRWRCALRQFRRFYQILENGKLLLVLLDRERVSIYLDHLHAINTAIRRERTIKNLNREKLGEDVLFAFDETQRSLAVCASTKVCCLLGYFVAMTYYARPVATLHVCFRRERQDTAGTGNRDQSRPMV